MKTTFTILCGLGCLFWCFAYLRMAYSLARVAHLHTLTPPTPTIWPKLSVLVAARNEGTTIFEALSSLLALDYPNLEFILINDRSTDTTGQIMDDLTADRPNVKVVHITQLPSGWMGKIHAMDVAAKHASGEWLLFTDADVHVSPEVLQQSMAHVLAEGADHLVLIPSILSKPFWLRVVIRTFTVLFITRFKVEKLRHASNTAFAGYGGFNLVKRAALDKTPGLEWLKMDVVDDVGMGLMLHNAGAKSLVAMAGPAVAVEWYPDLPSMFNGLAKNIFGAVAHYSVLRTVGMAVASAVFLASPLVAVGLVGAPFWLHALGYACPMTVLVCAITHTVRSHNASLAVSLFMPVGMFLLTLMAIYSMLVCIRNKGVVWRDTHYGLDELKRHQRLKL